MNALLDPALCKDLSDNRDRYVAQSRATRNGVVAELPPRPGAMKVTDEPEWDHPDLLVDYG